MSSYLARGQPRLEVAFLSAWRSRKTLVNFIIGFTGGGLLIYGLAAAIVAGSPYWYSYFVVGLFLFLDRCDALLNHDSNLSRLFNRNWPTPVCTYLVYLAGALILDLLFGSYLGNMWVYPHFNWPAKLIHVILIGYPLAFFCCAAQYRVLVKLLRNYLKTSSVKTEKIILSPRKLKIILLITILSTCFPVFYFFLVGRRHIQDIIFMCGVIGIFSLSPISLILKHNSWLKSILNQDWPVILALLISIPLNALAHELPNTFAWEWRYQNMPWASWEILGVPLIVLTLGWTYLTIFGISGNELFFHGSN
jgi:hypothetical protein